MTDERSALGPTANLGAAWPLESIEERAVTDADYEALWRLHVDAMHAYVAATYGWIDAIQASIFRERSTKNQAQRVLLHKGGIVAAWLVERRVEDVYLAFIEVAASHRRRGLGTVVLRRIMEAAAAARLPVRLQVMKANPDARRLYQRVGFSIEGETATHHLMIARPPV